MSFQVLPIETVQGGPLNSGHCMSPAPGSAHIADLKVQAAGTTASAA